MSEFKTPKRHLLYHEGTNIYMTVYTADIEPWLVGPWFEKDVIDVTGDYQHEINATGAPF